jgi:hypothetical protein
MSEVEDGQEEYIFRGISLMWKRQRLGRWDDECYSDRSARVAAEDDKR